MPLTSSSWMGRESLPQELIGDVVSMADFGLLTTIACACYTLQVEAERLLYRCLIIDDLLTLRDIHNALLAVPRRRLAVQSLSIPMRKRPLDEVDYEYCLRGILSLTDNLISLETLHYPTYQAPILHPPTGTSYTFRLRKLITQFAHDPYLVEFLTSQTEIEDLEVIGWNGGSEVPSTALPKLAKLTGTYEVISHLAPGRAAICDVTAEQLYTYLQPAGNYSPETLLVALSRAAGGITRLQLNMRDIQGLHIHQIGQAVPSLTELTLHTTFLPTNEILFSLSDRDWVEGLGLLKSLKYLRISMLEVMPPHQLSEKAETILNGWKTLCPSLSYVVFPDDREWGCMTEGGWEMAGISEMPKAGDEIVLLSQI
ncbi:hypothetical protein FRB94_001363 [Tulasnella sp. JGI-2019a]|nr:hypothetical protein FRB93_000636 [Tulasnella sp. JGI-2019a]KAG9005720.1 hypothetical protein FRB94_001363 [Tulasnella sp. JGI-2019a]KAG9034986.1 hypothetical protein FRB95_012276 [Tulasnella sp. JGI-2019a]